MRNFAEEICGHKTMLLSESSPGVFLDLYSVLNVYRRFVEEPSGPNPVEDFLSELVKTGFAENGIFYSKCERLLSNLRYHYQEYPVRSEELT